MFKLTWGDLWRGLVMAVLGPVMVAIIGVLGAVILAPNFDVFSVDYVLLFKSLINTFIVASFGAGSGYLMKNLLTDEQGNFLGIKTRS